MCFSVSHHEESGILGARVCIVYIAVLLPTLPFVYLHHHPHQISTILAKPLFMMCTGSLPLLTIHWLQYQIGGVGCFSFHIYLSQKNIPLWGFEPKNSPTCYLFFRELIFRGQSTNKYFRFIIFFWRFFLGLDKSVWNLSTNSFQSNKEVASKVEKLKIKSSPPFHFSFRHKGTLLLHLIRGVL